MAKILLDYAFPISVVTAPPAASTGWLKRVCVVAKPKGGQEGNVGVITACNSMDEVAVLTANENAEQLFNAGMSQVYILLANDLDLANAMTTYAATFFTLLISDDFDDSDVLGDPDTLTEGDLTFTAKANGVSGLSIEMLNTVSAGAETASIADGVISIAMESGVSTAQQIATAIGNSAQVSALITVAIAEGKEATAQTAFAEKAMTGGNDALDVGPFDGVVGVSSSDDGNAATHAAVANRCGFFVSNDNGADNMFFAFGSLLANQSNWLNQQYIPMPKNDGVDTLGQANALFDDKVSFVLNDDEYANRLALFACGGKAIAAPYILKNFCIDLQSRALQWIALNQPQYTVKNASLLESALIEDVLVRKYIARNWIEGGTISISLVEDNFVANGEIEVPEPRALWRVFNELRAT